VQQGVSLSVDTIQYRWIPADSRSLASNERQHAGRGRGEAARRAVTTLLRAAGSVEVIGPRMLNGAQHSLLAPCRRGFIEVCEPAHRTAEFPAGGEQFTFTYPETLLLRHSPVVGTPWEKTDDPRPSE
jgi:hypothetical protein